MEYDFKKVEKKWQEKWAKESSLFEAKDFDNKPKFYELVEFPYPSGAGLHVGHCMGYSASDAHSRMKRMQGNNVIFPIGWDAFGLPTENYAIKTGKNPIEVTKENTDTFRKQLKSLGYLFDWNREVNTTDPDYFRWTQWIFLQFYKHAIVDGKLIEVADDDTKTPRLAFQSEMPINWCPSCKIGLANEEVIGGKCERCGAEAEKKMQKQWMLRITAYADRLINDLDTVDYLEKIKTQQVNWIGRSEGAEVEFQVTSAKGQDSALGSRLSELTVFTTRPDTLFGATFMVVAPEHSIIDNLKSVIENIKEVEEYIQTAANKSDLERTDLAKEKTGVEIKGIKAINPINGKEIPIFVADYVLATYGTGAIMAVPAHDERDWDFAQKFNIPIIDVILPLEGKSHEGEEHRETVSAVVQRKSDNKFLLVKFKKYNWIAPTLGGIDEGESSFGAVEREVFEETGYKINAIKNLGGQIESHFYADHKKVWRSRHDQPILCELLEEEPKAVNGEEQEIQEPIWLTANEALQQITHPYNKLGIERYLKDNYAYTGDGIYVNSGFLNGLTNIQEAKAKTIAWLEENKIGKKTINFKLRDWIFSRQHYWGEPIPIVHCEKCGMVPIPEAELPVTLPVVENYQPTDTGESPLAAITDWVNTTCPHCGGKARRETDTMPNWAGSSWYFLAYVLKAQSSKLEAKSLSNVFSDNFETLKYWMPVDLYNGGMEHTTLHLLYSRFWNKFLFDLGVVPTSEPYCRRIAHGIILGSDNRKMSKSFGNVINPDEIVRKYGADAMRTYIMFIGPYDQESSWSQNGLAGVARFLVKVWQNFEKADQGIEISDELRVEVNKLVAGVEGDIESFLLNTYVAKLMTFNNILSKLDKIPAGVLKIYAQLLSLAAPHMAEEMWQNLGGEGFVSLSGWPKYDEALLKSQSIKMAVQVNGKVRDIIEIPADENEEEVKRIVLDNEKIKANIDGKEIVKVIVVPNKIVSIVVK